MQTPTEHAYYNPFDRRCWKAIAIGLPLLFIAIAAFAVVGRLVWGPTAATDPAMWLQHPWIPVGLAMLGGFALAFAAGLTWTAGLFAHAIGRLAMETVARKREPDE